MLAFTLPWPPSVNRYFSVMKRGPLAGRILISSAARRYRKTVDGVLLEQRIARPRLNGSVVVEIVAHPPDRRARDLDNILKPIVDSLKHARLVDDDRFVDFLSIRRGARIKGGSLDVRITQLVAAVEQQAIAGVAR